MKIILFILCACFPSILSAVKVHKISPITTDKEVRIEITLSAKANEDVLLNAIISHVQSKEVLCDVTKEFSFPNEVDTTVMWEIDHLNPELWSPVAPSLYNLEVKANANVLYKRIGFRKFEIKNGIFYLNDKPIYLRGNAINPPERGIPERLERSKDFARDYVRFMKKLNINIIRIPDDQNWMDVCDEEGMMIFAGRYGRPKHGTRTAPPTDFDLSFQTYKNVDLGPFASHPSVVIYILSNEMPYEGETGILYRDFLTKMCNELKKWDNTRLYIGNTGYGRGQSGDIYDVHRYWGWYYNTFLTYLNMRDTSMWQNLGRVQPITFTECVGNYTGIDGRFNLCSRTKQPGSQKCWTGHLPDSMQAEAAMTYQAFVLKNATEMFRRLRCQNNYLAGTMPFSIIFHNWDGVQSFADMKPKPAAWQYQISYQPILLSWENWQTQIYAGNKLSVVAHVVNDDDYCNDLLGACLRWSIVRKGEVLLSGEEALPSVPYYGTYQKALSIDIPRSLPTGDYLLKGEIWTNGKKVSYNESELFIAGESWREVNVPFKDTYYVYDSSITKSTQNCLRQLGCLVQSVQQIEVLPEKSTLVIGKDAWDENLSGQVDLLTKFIFRGGRVICLEQNPKLFKHSWLPVSLTFLQDSNNDPVYLSPSLAYKDGMNINLERPYHPVFYGLSPKHFRLWSDYTSFDESQKGFPAIYPVNRGYDLSKSDLKNIAILANYSRALAGTALCEIFMGQGSVLLSGFDLINHCGVDPVADRLLLNMLRYMSHDKRHTPYVVVNDSIVWGDYASERGIVNAPCNGLMVNTVPIVPKGQEYNPRYQLKIDQYGYQYAGAYGGWNSKPGVQYIPRGRRAMAPFTFSRGGSPVVSKSSTQGEGYFYMALPEKKCRMTTVFENPSNESVTISLSIDGQSWKEYSLLPKRQLSVETDISHVKDVMKVSVKGDRRVVLLKTILHRK